ncbi:MAG: ribosome-associated translation inhibitor RaiA [Bradyrhizobiaceae bacterium]|nr:ribosome-associated translation inhibitor RaiA [Bradyrhizobiaceae bacterium]
MLFRVSGKHINVGEALRARVSERVAEVMGKFFDGGFSGHATIGKEGFGFRTECVVHLDSGVTLHVDGTAVDAYASADQAALRIENRLRRYKRRLKAHAARADGPAKEKIPAFDARSYVVTAPDRDLDEEIVDFNPVIIAESTTTLERLSVSEAVMELDMTGAPVVMFRHAVHGRVNIVYRRADGNVGWLDPPAAA